MEKYNKFLSGNLRILVNGRNKKCSATILNFQGVFHSCPQLADVNIFFFPNALEITANGLQGGKNNNQTPQTAWTTSSVGINRHSSPFYTS